MIRRSITGAAALLVLFHGYLFAWQLWTGEFAKPGLTLRWVIAAMALRGLLAMRAARPSDVWGRKAVCIWLLVALLHGPSIAGAAEAQFTAPTVPAAVTAVLGIAASIGLVLAVAFAAFMARRGLAARWRLAVEKRSSAGLICAHHLRIVTPRPPPVPALVL